MNQNDFPIQLIVTEERIALLERLSNACAVSGNETAVREIVLEQLRTICPQFEVDTLGNVLTTRPANQPNPLRVMLAAHMDEIGLMVVDQQDGSFLQFETVGGIDDRRLPGQAVLVGNDLLPGVIGATPIHLTEPDERSRPFTANRLRIDMGSDGAKRIKPGDYAVFASKFQQSGPSLMGKALDDRLGVASLLTLLTCAPAQLELLAAFTVQEEVGLRGAGVAAHALQPDLAIVLDATPANDLPVWDDNENTLYNTHLGYGPALYVADGATLSDPRLVSLFLKTAEKHNIPFQIRQPGSGGTDAGSIHLRRGGIPSISLSVPIRYAHSPLSLARRADWENALKLVYAVLEELSPAVFEGLR